MKKNRWIIETIAKTIGLKLFARGFGKFPVISSQELQSLVSNFLEKTGRVLLLSYFREEMPGLHLAYSDDGFDWLPLNNNRPIYSPILKYGSLMRDPYIARGADGLFHLVWTAGWKGKYIGYSESKNLIWWREAKYLPVMSEIKDCRNCWAPEFVYDEQKDQYLIHWTSIAGGKKYHRIWSAETQDFKEISKPSIFFDPGFSCIDATIVKNRDKWHLVFQDERGKWWSGIKAIRTATSNRVGGPYGNISGTITPRPVEAPALLRVGDKWILFYEYYVIGRYGASFSEDFKSWSVVKPLPNFPPGAKHATIFPVSEKIFIPLRDYFES